MGNSVGLVDTHDTSRVLCGRHAGEGRLGIRPSGRGVCLRRVSHSTVLNVTLWIVSCCRRLRKVDVVLCFSIKRS